MAPYIGVVIYLLGRCTSDHNAFADSINSSERILIGDDIKTDDKKLWEILTYLLEDGSMMDWIRKNKTVCSNCSAWIVGQHKCEV